MTYFDDGDVRLYCADALEALRELPDQSVHMACTSPPFFGLRDYGTGTWVVYCPTGVACTGCRHCEVAREKADACDHKATSGEERKFTNGRGEGVDDDYAGSNLRSWTTRDGTTYGQTCGKCGARRIDGQIGLESSPDEWAARLADVFREVRRVLRDDGTLWVECGDSYSGGRGEPFDTNQDGGGKKLTAHSGRPKAFGSKPKDLIGQPWLLAFALRADGWYLRSCIVWAKPNCMPESVTDRPTTAHSYVFLFSKRPRYFYDAEALRDPADPRPQPDPADKTISPNGGTPWMNNRYAPGASGYGHNPAGRNTRSVWTIPTEPNALAICRVCDAFWQGGAPREHCGQPVVQHFAAFPRELVRRMILAGTSERGVCAECGAPWVREVGVIQDGKPAPNAVKAHGGIGNNLGGGRHQAWRDANPPQTLGWHPTCDHGQVGTVASPPVPAIILDPFAGSGTSLLVARQLGRHAIGIELNERYAAMCKARMSQLSLLA